MRRRIPASVHAFPSIAIFDPGGFADLAHRIAVSWLRRPVGGRCPGWQAADGQRDARATLVNESSVAFRRSAGAAPLSATCHTSIGGCRAFATMVRDAISGRPQAARQYNKQEV